MCTLARPSLNPARRHNQARRPLGLALLAGCAALAALPPAPASALYIYAGADWRRFASGDDPYHCQTALDGVLIMTDTVVYGINVAGGVYGGAYGYGETYPSGGVPPGMIRITTVYGIDMEPNNPVMRLTGFNAVTPEMTPLSAETIFSRFNTQYSSGPAQAVRIAALPTVLAGHDLSPFAAGAPDSIVYVFQVMAPAHEFLANTCYANCDGSTVAPTLNVNDFICFQSQYAAGDLRADCDQNTALNVNDFVCFQSAFAAGCP